MGTKTSGHIFHWRFVKDVVKRELSSPWKRRGNGQQGRRKYPRKGYTRCRGGSSGCGPHNTPPGQKNKKQSQTTRIRFYFCLFVFEITDPIIWICGTSGSGQHAHFPSCFLQQVEPVAHTTESLQGTESTTHTHTHFC